MRMLWYILRNPKCFMTLGRTIDHHLIHALIKGMVEKIINPIETNGSKIRPARLTEWPINLS